MDLTEEEDAALREIFDAFDAVKSGAIDSRELTEGARLYGLNPTRTEVDTAWSSKDVDNSGTLSYDQFKTLVISMKKTDEVSSFCFYIQYGKMIFFVVVFPP